jgi:uncharacterized membrane-anchored protein YitT (DUF2179 family)
MSAREARGAGRHSALDDVQALFTGTAFIALGVAMYSHSGLLSGGTAGLAFLAHYLLNVPFGAVFFVLNLPFYWLAWRQLGRRFTVKTLVAVSMLSGMVELQPHLVSFQALDPLYAAVLGGLLMGTGFLIMFRHKASLGGVGILALVLQERKGWRAGHVQLAIDCAIVVAALISVEPTRVLFSVAGAVALNMVLAINHRPGRYVAQ